MSVAKQLRFSRRTVDVAPAGAGDGASPKLRNATYDAHL